MEQVHNTRSIVVMGVSGSGKTTIGQALSKRIGSTFLDADALHTQENIAKMSSGHALDDDDRWPWLRSVGQHIKDFEENHRGSVTACSALKRSYRDVLRDCVPDLFFVFLDGTPDVITARVETRSSGFLPPILLTSQFDILEPLEADETGLRVDAVNDPDEIINVVTSYLSATS